MAEQALHAHPRAHGAADRGDLWHTTGVTAYQHALLLVSRTRDNLYISDCGDTGQCLTTKPQGRQPVQVINMPDFAGGEALQCEGGPLSTHTTTVIGHLDEMASAVGQVDVNACAASIEGIIDQLFHHRGGTLDHFPSGNATGRGWIESLNTRRHVE